MSKYATLRHYKRVWAIGAIRGEAHRLFDLHREIAKKFLPGDRIVYLGNMIGEGQYNLQTIDEILSFRRLVISQPGMFAKDVVFLRGQMEEMWQKLLQLQFAPNPKEILPWMLEHGMLPLILAYGGDIERGIAAARDGALSITRWTAALREAMHAKEGHWNLFGNLFHGALTDDKTLLFIHAGLNPDEPLETQGDILWWGNNRFEEFADKPYPPFHRVIRGNSPAGIQNLTYGLSIDAGAGQGGKLMAVCLERDGNVSQQISA